VEGLTLAEMRDADVCCGFAHVCVKYPDISTRSSPRQADHIAATAPTRGSPAISLPHENMAGQGCSAREYACARATSAEVLANMSDTPAIGEPPRPERIPMTVPLTSPHFKENARAALADAPLQQALKFVEVNFIARRREVASACRVRCTARCRARHQGSHA